MIIDAHVHIGRGERLDDTFQIELRREDVIAGMDEAGVDVSCAMAVACDDYEEANREIQAAVQAYPGRLIGYARANLHDRARAEAQIRRCFGEYGFRGIKIQEGVGDGFPTRWLMAMLSEYGWPLLLHAPGVAEKIEAMTMLARAYPRVPVVLGHMGGYATHYPTFVKACALGAKQIENLYLDTASLTWYQWVKIAVDICGPEKVLLGSDSPAFHPALAVKVIELCHFPEADRALILGGNAARLLRLTGRAPGSGGPAIG